MMTIHSKTEINDKRLKEFIELSEEPSFEKIIDSALALFYMVLRNITKGYRLALIPYTLEGEPDPTRATIFVNAQVNK